jgi:hypothetical protein
VGSLPHLQSLLRHIVLAATSLQNDKMIGHSSFVATQRCTRLMDDMVRAEATKRKGQADRSKGRSRLAENGFREGIA